MDKTDRAPAACLKRTTFRTSRLLDFCSRKELIAQTGHQPEEWPLVLLKELVDNALDACEEAEVAPEITITVDAHGVTVADNGPGIPEDTVAGVLDFTARASSREAYVAPDRGAQGNALMTLVAMPFVLDGKRGDIEIVAQGEADEAKLPSSLREVITKRLKKSPASSWDEVVFDLAKSAHGEGEAGP